MKTMLLATLLYLGLSPFALARNYITQNIKIILTHNSATSGSQQLSRLKGTLVFSDDHQFCKITLKQGDSFECYVSSTSNPAQNFWAFWIYVSKSDIVHLLSNLGMKRSDTDQFKESHLVLHHESWDGLHHAIDSILISDLNPTDVSQSYSFVIRH